MEVCTNRQGTEQTYYRWSTPYGEMRADDTKQLKVLERAERPVDANPR